MHQAAFEPDVDGGSCCWVVERSLPVVGGVAAREEQSDRFVELDGAVVVVVVEKVARLRMEESFRLVAVVVG